MISILGLKIMCGAYLVMLIIAAFEKKFILVRYWVGALILTTALIE